jgi:subtilisin family serine protease
VKRRNRANGRRGWKSRQAINNLFAKRNPRKQKSYTFEHLEARYAFSATPLNLPEPVSYSSDTPEGAAAILLREMQWHALQAASMNGTIDAVARALPTDPYFPTAANPKEPGQWHLWNTGQLVTQPEFDNELYGVPGEDINVIGAWNLGYTGEGVIVAVLDDGIQWTHPDLFGNTSPEFAFNAFNGTNNALPSLLAPSHGTAVAGLIGATWSLENGVPVSGGVGVAPGVTLVPIKMLGNDNVVYGPEFDPILNAFRYAMLIGADITNNSWGPPDTRQIQLLDPVYYQLLRDMAVFGRDGLGMINVFAAGNGAGTGGAQGFPGSGSADSAAYDPFVNSRYVIGVTGVDHDGQYANADGTVTAYSEAGPNVLVAAPTGSNVAQNIANDTGQGSGLWTTDLVGDFGYNAAPDPVTGIDDDRDFLADPDYMSRFNGTSGAAPIVSGVIALMLDANPNLTLRDVQEILVRSARQNAQFETPESGGGVFQSGKNPWQVNQNNPFRDPDSWDIGVDPIDALFFPLADPRLSSIPYSVGQEWAYSPGSGNDIGREFGHYELQPEMWTNDAGYTVAQGYGTYGELIGYGHGVIDAELAVTMARDWHTLDQGKAPGTEKTFTTFIGPGGIDLLAAEVGSDDASNMLVPGGIGTDAGFIGFWDEYFADPPAPFDPANADSWPDPFDRGASYIDFVVPMNQQINVEWVEVKITIEGPAEGLDFLKIQLVSPNGMHSELNHFYRDATLDEAAMQPDSVPADGWGFDFGGATIADPDAPDGVFTWTFSTNRNWGESTNGAVIIDPYTGEPVAGSGIGGIAKPIRRDWELHLENWGGTDLELGAVEIVWHGKPIEGGTLDQEWLAEGFAIPTAQRIQGFVGVDLNSDDEFSGIDPLQDNEWNNRYIQTFNGDPNAPRVGDLERRLLDDYQDVNFNGVFDEGDIRMQEPFAANILVEAYEFQVVNGVDVVSPTPIAQFLTGADGNYYFDLVPGNYIIRATDRNADAGTFVDDPNTPAGFRQHYKDEWRITSDWFYAPDRDVPTAAGAQGEIFYDAVAQAPVAFRFDVSEPRIPSAVRDINFLIRPQDTPPNQVIVSGTVFADVNQNGAVDIFDAPASNIRVYVDSSGNGEFDPGEEFVYTDANGAYQLTVETSVQAVVSIGVDLQPGWAPSIVGGDIINLLAQPGDVITNQNFFLNPPDDPSGSGLGNITGFVFNDTDADGTRDLNEVGLAGVTVFIDANSNGSLDGGEKSAVTAANGGYYFANVAPGTYRVDVVIAGEGTPAQVATMTVPGAGYRTVTLTAGETEVGVFFGLDSLADKDFGDLPASYNAGGANSSHTVVPHFRLGATVDGEVAGQGSGADNATDDGIVILGDGLLHPGANNLQVTVAGVGGFLSGWVDWNLNGQFDANERLSFTDANTGEVLGQQADLGPGTHTLTIQAPALVNGSVAARFRWGEYGINLGTQSFIGEVEDYFLPTSAVIVAPSLPGDFNNDGGVNAADYVVWRKLNGTSASMPNSTNPSGPVVPADEQLWKSNFGETAPGSGGGGGSGGESVDESSEPVATPPLEALGRTGGASVSVVDVLPAVSSATASTDSFATLSTFVTSLSVDISAAETFDFDAAFEVVGKSVASEESAANDVLLLLDQAIAELDDSDDEAPLNDRNADEDESNELALAVAFEDDSAWWSM